MKFKEGYRVRVRYGSFNDDYEGELGTCIIDPVHDNAEFNISIIFDNPKFNGYYSKELGLKVSNDHFYYEDLELAELPYTKITEKLMKDKIDYIKEGIIYLK